MNVRDHAPALAFSEDLGRFLGGLAIARHLGQRTSDDRVVRLWDPTTGDCLHELVGHNGWVTAVCAVPTATGTLVASAGYDGTVRLWDPYSGRPTMELATRAGWVTAVCAVGYGPHRLLASAGYDDVVLLWDPVTGEQVRTIDAVSGPVTGLCMVEVAGLTMLVVTGEDGGIKLYNPSTGRSHMTFGTDDNTVHTERVRGMAINDVCAIPAGDGDLLVSASDDRTVRIWDPTTGAVTQSIPVHHRALSCRWASARLVIGHRSRYRAVNALGGGRRLTGSRWRRRPTTADHRHRPSGRHRAQSQLARVRKPRHLSRDIYHSPTCRNRMKYGVLHAFSSLCPRVLLTDILCLPSIRSRVAAR